ncbi:hypothetical protein C8R43DRAFT_563008 [Mycena crocata]|nr:hypothetical protein C8R43DRAFT_563008 [Mycena crocata]
MPDNNLFRCTGIGSASVFSCQPYDARSTSRRCKHSGGLVLSRACSTQFKKTGSVLESCFRPCFVHAPNGRVAKSKQSRFIRLLSRKKSDRSDIVPSETPRPDTTREPHPELIPKMTPPMTYGSPSSHNAEFNLYVDARRTPARQLHRAQRQAGADPGDRHDGRLRDYGAADAAHHPHQRRQLCRMRWLSLPPARSSLSVNTSAYALLYPRRHHQ